MAVPRIAMFATAEVGHFRRLVPLMLGLRRRGAHVDVHTHARFREEVERAGATFFDLFEGRARETADAESVPNACRSVSFAGHYAEAIIEEVRRRRPTLILYDTFAVIGYVVARALELPCVNVCAGHNVSAAMFPAALAEFPRVHISERCHAAVERLRERYGITQASPFFFAAAVSPWLNVYCEPPQYLLAHERRIFEPVAFFGSLEEDDGVPEAVGAGPEANGAAPSGAVAAVAAPSAFGGTAADVRVYVSFGTVVWRYFQREALAALATIAQELSARPGVRTIIALGGQELPAADLQTLALPGITVVRTADQCAVLREADVFVTHNGLNSTHEAIDHGVPMLSYPFFWDQPSLARKCREFGLAVPLCERPRQPLSRADVARALDEVAARGYLQPELARARAWELAAIAGRERIFQRILRLASASASASSSASASA